LPLSERLHWVFVEQPPATPRRHLAVAE